MIAIEAFFWMSVFVLLYVYLGYPTLLNLMAIVRRNLSKTDGDYQPNVSLIIAAYNEEAVIGEKIENSLRLDYPKDKLEIIVFSDASTDRTDEIVKSYADRGVKLLRIEGRKGKTYCQNEAIKAAQGEILVFSDANSMYEPDAIKKLVRNFADPSVGCAVGELRYHSSDEGGNRGVEGEGVYWRYEQAIKRLESRVSSPTAGNGSIYAARKALIEPLLPEAPEDFVRPLKIIQSGYRAVYEPEAVAWEQTASETGKEFRRRVRMVTQAVSILMKDRSLLSLLNPLRFGLFALQLWSHKILRWLSGLFLVFIFLFNIPLLRDGPVYVAIMAIQVLFYLAVLWGLVSEVIFKKPAPKLPHVAYYFCLSCYAMLKGVFLALRGHTMATWQPSR